jgi:hypothetical protein
MRSDDELLKIEMLSFLTPEERRRKGELGTGSEYSAGFGKRTR